MNGQDFLTYRQDSAYASPHTAATRVRLLLWDIAWQAFCAWTPKPANRWRILWLRAFGCKISGLPFVHQRARIAMPWNLTLRDRACLGDGAVAYSLGPIVLEVGCTIGQEAYLCTGTHDFGRPEIPLMTAPIMVGAHAFVGARAFVMPGIIIGERAVIGACSVLTKNADADGVFAGNPARFIKLRSYYEASINAQRPE